MNSVDTDLTASSTGQSKSVNLPADKAQTRKWYHGLTFRQAAITLAIALLFSLMSSAFAVYTEWRKVRDDAQAQKLELLAQARQTAPLLLLEQKNRVMQDAVMKGLMSHPLAVHAEVTRDVNDEQRKLDDDVQRMNDAVFREFQPRQAKYELSEIYGERLFGSVAVGSTYLTAIKNDKPTQVGQFNLVFSSELMADRFFDRVFQEAALALIREFLIALVIVSLFYFFITRPLVKLSGAISQINPAEPGSWQPPALRLHVKDEIGDVSARLSDVLASFQTGLDQRNQARSELTELNADLERRVVQRTHELQRTFDDLDRAHNDLSRANRQMLDSISYAKRIQEAMLATPDALNGYVKNLSLWWQPLHTVGGDFYSLQRYGDPSVPGDEKALIFIADCTGHGVPGAFLTLVVANALEQLTRTARDSSNAQRLNSPAHMLRALDAMVRWRLQQSGDAEFDDGFDAGLCLWDAKTRELNFAGAGIGLLQVAADNTGTPISTYYRGSRKGLGSSHSIGNQQQDMQKPQRGDVLDQRILVPEQARYFLFSDGTTDHVGGANKQLFGRRRLNWQLEKTMSLPLGKQMFGVKQELARYRDGGAIRDDITCIAIEL
jgi:two-component system, sensor histidine kinase SagS